MVFTLPLTDLSSPMLNLPLPDAVVVTGGVSSAPLRVTLTSFAQAEPMPSATANARQAPATRIFEISILIAISLDVVKRSIVLRETLNRE
jgi:hypothetical protein